jgi:hypothetical protein
LALDPVPFRINILMDACPGTVEHLSRPPLRVLLRGDGIRALAVVHDASSLPPARLNQGDPREARLVLSAGQLAADWGWVPVSEGKLCWCLLL